MDRIRMVLGAAAVAAGVALATAPAALATGPADDSTRPSSAGAAGGAAGAADVGAGGSGDPANTAEARDVPADNTGRNVRDRGDTLTPMDQANNEKDVELTRKIRGEVVADDSLSLKAHNVKIISQDGVVTLRGPVESEAERERIASLAEKTAGAGNVRNHLEVTQ